MKDKSLFGQTEWEAEVKWPIMKPNLTIGGAVGWTAIYFGVMLFYTFLNVAVWRKVFPGFSSWLNILTIAICVCGFLALLKRAGHDIALFANLTPSGVALALGCSALFYLLLDKGLDPLFEKAFPSSEQAYQETVEGLTKAPVASFLQICVIAPVIEELLMRGFILSGLRTAYGTAVGLLVSSVLFALLHLNMVQTLSSLICGVVLGLLYIKTGSVFCCIIGHCGYNLLSYFSMIYPRISR